MKSIRKFFYITSKGGIDSDSEWKQQNERMKNNEVYDMVNFGGGGKFIDVYDQNGPKESFAKKKARIQEYFNTKVRKDYLHEESCTMTKEMYHDWSCKQRKIANKYMKHKEKNEEVVDGIFEDDTATNYSVASLETVIKSYNEHSIKWKIDKRGAVGETPMHLLFLNNSEKHINIARAILEIYPELAIDLYEGSEYFGESCLHLAIIQENVKAVNLLLSTGEHLEKIRHARARGKFFRPMDVKRGDVKLRKHKFEGYAYYGEFPLSFAASSGNREIYDLLIKHGCNPTLQDRFGNTVLHLTVIHDQPDMYYHAVKHSQWAAKPDVTNKDGLTPLALAAKLGRKEMFEKILEISSKEYWSYNTVTCSVYPLKSLDTIGPKGKTDWNSALMMIIRGTKQGHLDMVSNNVVHQLLKEKWKHFAKAKFLRLLFYYLLHIAIMSTAVYLRPDTQTDLRYGTSAQDIARYVFEGLTVLICLFVLFYMCREIYLESLIGFLQNVVAIPSRVVYLLATILILLCIPFRFLELYDVEIWLLVFAIPGLWSYLLFFLRSLSLFGPLIIMIYKILTSDLFRFVIIYIIIILTSTVAFYYQYEGQNIAAFSTPQGSAMTLFQMSFGEFNHQDILRGKYSSLSIILFIVFMVIVHILLLNMLIAMMTRTFDKITNRSEKVWKQQWAAMVVTMERSHRNSQKREFQQLYDMDINTERVSSEGAAVTEEEKNKSIEYDARALMVIRHQQTSETERRRTLQRGWRSVGKKAVEAKAAAEEEAQVKLQIHSLAGMTSFLAEHAPREPEFGEEEDADDNPAENLLSAVTSQLQKSFSRRNSTVSNAGSTSSHSHRVNAVV